MAERTSAGCGTWVLQREMSEMRCVAYRTGSDFGTLRVRLTKSSSCKTCTLTPLTRLLEVRDQSPGGLALAARRPVMGVDEQVGVHETSPTLPALSTVHEARPCSTLPPHLSPGPGHAPEPPSPFFWRACTPSRARHLSESCERNDRSTPIRKATPRTCLQASRKAFRCHMIHPASVRCCRSQVQSIQLQDI